MTPRWIVTERYPDGGTWTHAFFSSVEALEAIELMQSAHRGRSYAITYK
jgi:hypothetical protein